MANDYSIDWQDDGSAVVDLDGETIEYSAEEIKEMGGQADE